jgi:hypothetical protein
MKLIRFDGNKTGLVVELASGIHVVDVVASIGALVPEDPISHGVLNGLLKDTGSWAQLIQHWGMARKGLRRLAVLAQASGPTQVVLRRLDEVRGPSARHVDGIGSLNIGELEAVSQDPTGRNVMERQFSEAPQGPTDWETMTTQSSGCPPEATPSDDRVVLLSNARTGR